MSGHGARRDLPADLEALIDRAPYGAAVVQGEHLTINRAASELLGFRPDEVATVTSWCETLLPDPDYRAEMQAKWAQDLEGAEERIPVVVRVRRKDGCTRHLSFSRPTVLPGPIALTWFHDVTQQVEEHEALRISEGDFRAMMRSAEGFVVYRLRREDGANPFGAVVELVSPSLREVVGVHDVDDFEAWFAGIHPEDAPNVIAKNAHARETGETFDEMFRTYHPGKREYRWMHAISNSVRNERGEVTHFNGLIVDITAQKKVEVENAALLTSLHRAAHFESMGSLAGGLAHDFNNLLTTIMGTLDILRDEVTLGAEHRALLESAETAARSGASLTRDMLSYARRETSASHPVEVNPIVSDVAKMARHTAQRVEVVTELGEGPCVVRGDRAQIERVLLNLALNGCDAMPNGGRLTFRTGTAEPRDLPLHLRAGREPYFCVEVRDEGEGMVPQVLHRVFEPFFTTKHLNRGTGLGLASADGLVRTLGGALTVTSKVGVGSVFRVHLPLSDDSVISAVAPTPVVQTVEGVALLADDEAAVRGITTSLLQRLGLRVHAVPDGERALERFEELQDNLTLAVIDIVMPGLSGVDVLRRLRARAPDLPVLLYSGYAPALDEVELDAKSAFLSKPFTLVELSQAVGRLLSPRADSTAAEA